MTRVELKEYLPTIFPMLQVFSSSTQVELFTMMEIKRLSPHCLLATESLPMRKFQVFLEGSVDLYTTIGKKPSLQMFNLRNKNETYPQLC